MDGIWGVTLESKQGDSGDPYGPKGVHFHPRTWKNLDSSQTILLYAQAVFHIHAGEWECKLVYVYVLSFRGRTRESSSTPPVMPD